MLRLLRTPANEMSPALSRDGRWLAYESRLPTAGSCLLRTPQKVIPSFPGKPQLWCDTLLPERHLDADFDVAPDGNRLAVQVPWQSGQNKPVRVSFVLNFADELRTRVQAKR